MIERQGLTLLGISLQGLEDDSAVQLALPYERTWTIDAVIDDVREKFGTEAITRAVLLGRDAGYTMPQLPD
jgi:DNA polymerase-4